MNADLAALVRLQETRNRIAALSERIEGEIPNRIAELETELREVREKVDESKAQIDAAQKERARLEQEFAAAEDKINKNKAALMQVKNNDEYRAALNEIDYTGKVSSDLETRVLELMDAVEVYKEELKVFESELAVEDEKIHVDRKVLEDERAELDASRQDLESEAAQIEAKLPVPLLNAYRRIAEMRGGRVLALAGQIPASQDGVCGACNMRLRPAAFQQVKRNEGVMRCDSCGRILYFVPPPEAQPDSAEEAVAAAATPETEPATEAVAAEAPDAVGAETPEDVVTKAGPLAPPAEPATAATASSAAPPPAPASGQGE